MRLTALTRRILSSPPPRRWRIAVPVAAATAITAITLVNPFSAHAATTLLSQGRPATASSTESAGTPASAAVDGDAGTRWASAFSDPQWLQVDLGATATITQVELQWETASATAFQIQVSADAATWKDIYATTSATGGTQTLAVTGSGRYVRMLGTARATGYGYSLWEFQVYGESGSTPTACGTTNAAQGRPATASSVENDGTPASAAFDADPGTRWSSAASDPQWLQVDLGSSLPVCQLVLTWETASAKAYQIQVSDNGSAWTTAYSTASGAGGTETVAVQATGRYVRMVGTARNTGYGYSLWEMAVRTGTSSPTPTPSTGPSGDWTPVWTEDFTGAAGTAPASASWITRTGTAYPGGPANWGTGEVETMSAAPANLSLDGSGHLAVTALRDGSGAWTSGRIETQRTDFAAPAGGQLKVTATLRQPDPAAGTGYWPGLRLVGAGYRSDMAAWPAMGELDVMTDVNGRSQTAATLHCGTAPGGPCNEYTGLSSGLLTCPGCQTGHHTYTVVIDRSVTDEQIRWYVDDQQTWVVRESQVGAAAWQAAVDHGFFIKLDLAVGGSLPDAVCGCTSPTPDTTSGGTLSVDQIAVSQATGQVPPAFTTPTVPSGASSVHVTGSQGNWQLTVDGAPYTVKGLTYGPPADAADGYLNDLKGAGVNTIRTWGTDAGSRPLFDSAAARGITVVAGFWLNHGADYVGDTTYKTDTLNDIRTWVNTYKGHPGVLMWDVGNEVLLTLQDTYSGTELEAERNAYAAYVDEVARAIHAIDPNHPVTSTDAWTGAWPYYRNNAPDLDLYALNSYGDIAGAKQAWISGGYTKPYIITEGGPAGEWEVPDDVNGVPTEPTDVQKRDGYTAAWNAVQNHPGVALGATLFHYGIENDFGGVWLNTFTGGWHRLGYAAVRQAYTGQAPADTAPVISSMSVNPVSTVAAGSQFTVTTSTSDPDGDPIRYNLMLCAKYIDNGTGLRHATFAQTGAGTFSVTAPQQLGVWKVYVYAYDGQGNVGIETRSFTVVPPTIPGTDLAAGRSATASSYQPAADGKTYLPGNVTDGNYTTRWASGWSDAQWIQVDLGSTQSFNRLLLGWESAYATDYQVQTSTDGSTWTTVHSTTSGDGGFDDLAVSGTGRYVRLNLTRRATTYGYSLWEFGVYRS